MINPVSFQLDFQKFGQSERIELNPGLHVVYGESGCGKSHLIRSLAGLERAAPTAADPEKRISSRVAQSNLDAFLLCKPWCATRC